MESQSKQQFVQSVERSLDILNCFTVEQQTLSIAELVAKLGLPKSTIFRLLNTLKSKNFIEQEQHTQRYKLGFKMYELGNTYGFSMDVRKIAYPIMKELNEKTAETVHLNILDDGDRVCIERIESQHEIRSFVKIGRRSSLCFGAAGKTLLAFLPEDEIKKIIMKENLNSEEEYHLRNELTHIREKRFIVTIGDRVMEKISISAPIFNSNGQMVAGVSLAGPIERLKPRIDSLVEDVLSSAQTISLRMGLSKSYFDTSNTGEIDHVPSVLTTFSEK